MTQQSSLLSLSSNFLSCWSSLSVPLLYYSWVTIRTSLQAISSLQSYPDYVLSFTLLFHFLSGSSVSLAATAADACLHFLLLDFTYLSPKERSIEVRIVFGKRVPKRTHLPCKAARMSHYRIKEKGAKPLLHYYWRISSYESKSNPNPLFIGFVSAIGRWEEFFPYLLCSGKRDDWDGKKGSWKSTALDDGSPSFLKGMESGITFD